MRSAELQGLQLPISEFSLMAGPVTLRTTGKTVVKKSGPIQNIEPNEELVKAAVAEGRALIDQGKTKVEAAMAIYTKIEGESQVSTPEQKCIGWAE